MTENNESKINELYTKMINTADTMAADGITKESIEALKSVEEGVNKLTLEENTNPLYVTSGYVSTDNDELETEDATVTSTDAEESTVTASRAVMQSYNPANGEQMVVDGSESMAERIAARHLDNFINDKGEISTELMADVFKELGKTTDNENGQAVIATLIARRMAGETFDVYSGMPDEYKRQVDMIYTYVVSKAPMNQRSRFTKNNIAKMIIDDMINDFRKTNSSQVDLDTILSGFDEDVKKLHGEISNELGGIMMNFDDERKAEIDAAIKRCQDEGKTAAVEKLQKMRDTIDEAFHLPKFIEFCSTCKIRNIEIKEPEKRVFSYFNSKYEKHKYVINDIRSCPTILARHFDTYTNDQLTALCVAFCKYCQNMSPDNMDEHTFMYYFIRNIIAIDRLNPKGRMYEVMDDRSKYFYDTYTEALKNALDNLIKRNPKLVSESSN